MQEAFNYAKKVTAPIEIIESIFFQESILDNPFRIF
jgi:hypothetical protein